LQRGQTEGWSVTPRMLIGAGIGLYSAYIRYESIRSVPHGPLIEHILRHRCYAALGERFTLGLSTYKAQKLPLVTGGPYAIVRHASYTAVIMAMWRCAGFLTSGGNNTLFIRIHSASMVLLDPTSSISNATGAWWYVTFCRNSSSLVAYRFVNAH